MMRMMMASAVLMMAAGIGLAQTMPAGHPPVGGASGGAALPAGHPPMGAAGGTGAMPAGHPSMDQLMNGGMGAATQPGAMKMTGKLTVMIVPGTNGSKVTADEPVTVELFHRNTLVRQPYELKTDATGKIEIADLPVMPPVQARVSVKHGGLLQQAMTPELSPSAPEQAIELKVYETTETTPAWNIGMAHVLVQRLEDGSGVRVTQMFMSTAEGDKAWLGDKAGNDRVTMTIPLPAGANEVGLARGFDVDLTKLVDGKLVTGGALYPGRSIYEFSYSVPAKDGAINLPIAVPAAVGMLMVAAPTEGMDVKATGLNSMGVKDMGEGEQARMFGTSGLKAGDSVSLALTGIKAVTETATAAAKPTSAFTAKNIAMGGAFLMVLVGAGLMLMRKPAGKAEVKN